jgi:hypothetical protein
LNHDILGFLNQSKTPGHCGFPLANLQSAESLHFVPLVETCRKQPKYCVFHLPVLTFHSHKCHPKIARSIAVKISCDGFQR